MQSAVVNFLWRADESVEMTQKRNSANFVLVNFKLRQFKCLFIFKMGWVRGPNEILNPTRNKNRVPVCSKIRPEIGGLFPSQMNRIPTGLGTSKEICNPYSEHPFKTLTKSRYFIYRHYNYENCKTW